MYSKTSLLVLLLWVSTTPLVAQNNCFLTTFSSEDKSWLVTDAVETSMGDYLLCAYDDWGGESLILKLSSEGEIVGQVIVAATDTALYAYKLLTVPENHDGLIILCLCHPDDGSKAALLLVRVDEDLNITLRRTIPCPFLDEGDRFFSAKFLLLDSSIIGALSSRPLTSPISNARFLAKFDLNGNLFDCKRLESMGPACSLFCACEESNQIGWFGQLSGGMGIQVFDASLSLAQSDTLYQWSAPEGGNGDFCHYHINDVVNSQATMLPDGSYMVSARLLETLCHANGSSFKSDRSVILAKYENDFHQPKDMIVIEHMNDSVKYPAFFRSMDLRETDEKGCMAFQCSILNEFPQFGLLQPYSTGIVVTKVDQDLTVEWKRRFLRDGNYQATAIHATTDGGCLVVGSIGNYQAQRLDVFALKINAEGTVGINEIQKESKAFVYPNPVKETLKIGGVEAKETLVYSILGQRVMAFAGNEADVKALAAGFYLLKTTDKNGALHMMRIVIGK